MECDVRSACRDDAEDLARIYEPYVLNTAITFEEEPPAAAAFAARMTSSDEHPWLVAVMGERCVGYAYACPHRPRASYRFSVETSIYVDQAYCGRGIGRRLYTKLLEVLRATRFCNAYAGIALPNDASRALHLSLGFRQIGVFPAVGYKFDQWHDVAWYHRPIKD